MTEADAVEVVSLMKTKNQGGKLWTFAETRPNFFIANEIALSNNFALYLAIHLSYVLSFLGALALVPLSLKVFIHSFIQISILCSILDIFFRFSVFLDLFNLKNN